MSGGGVEQPNGRQGWSVAVQPEGGPRVQVDGRWCLLVVPERWAGEDPVRATFLFAMGNEAGLVKVVNVSLLSPGFKIIFQRIECAFQTIQRNFIT